MKNIPKSSGAIPGAWTAGLGGLGEDAGTCQVFLCAEDWGMENHKYWEIHLRIKGSLARKLPS